jgi:hypothetical protein
LSPIINVLDLKAVKALTLFSSSPVMFFGGGGSEEANMPFIPV